MGEQFTGWYCQYCDHYHDGSPVCNVLFECTRLDGTKKWLYCLCDYKPFTIPVGMYR